MRKKIFLQIHLITTTLLIIILSTCFTFATETKKQLKTEHSRSIPISLYTDMSLSFGRDFLFKQTFYDIDPLSSDYRYRRNERNFSFDKEGIDFITGIRFSLHQAYAEISINNLFWSLATQKNESPKIRHFWRSRLGYSFEWSTNIFEFGISTIQNFNYEHEFQTTVFSSTYKHNYRSVCFYLSIAYSRQQIELHDKISQSIDWPKPRAENIYFSIKFTAPKGYFRPYVEFTGAMLKTAKEVYVIPNYMSLITVGFQFNLNKNQPILSGTDKELYPKAVIFD